MADKMKILVVDDEMPVAMMMCISAVASGL